MTGLVLGYYLIASVLAFVVYAVDKYAAVKGRWRVREATLHLLALAGGWPGALVAQRLLRHKTRKRAFQWMFRVTVVINCCAAGWLLTLDTDGFRSVPGLG